LTKKMLKNFVVIEGHGGAEACSPKENNTTGQEQLGRFQFVGKNRFLLKRGGKRLPSFWNSKRGDVCGTMLKGQTKSRQYFGVYQKKVWGGPAGKKKHRCKDAGGKKKKRKKDC